MKREKTLMLTAALNIHTYAPVSASVYNGIFKKAEFEKTDSERNVFDKMRISPTF
jgi:hypothetical protein